MKKNVNFIKKYEEKIFNIKPSYLNTITPNPGINQVTIDYKLNQTTSAYLMVLGSYGATASSYNYILDLNSYETTIDISNYPNGFTLLL